VNYPTLSCSASCRSVVSGAVVRLHHVCCHSSVSLNAPQPLSCSGILAFSKWYALGSPACVWRPARWHGLWIMVAAGTRPLRGAGTVAGWVVGALTVGMRARLWAIVSVNV